MDSDREMIIAVLARLVRDEFPSGLSLAEIADIWGTTTEAEIVALRRYEASLLEALVGG